MNDKILQNAVLVTPDGVRRSNVLLHDGKMRLLADAEAAGEIVDLDGKYVVPGFVDIHMHGGNLFDFTLGEFDQSDNNFDPSDSAYKRGFQMLQKRLTRTGTTSFYLASFAAPLETLKNCYGNLAAYQKKPKAIKGARLVGGLLEGSFINSQMAGAQNPELQLSFSPSSFDEIGDAGSIKLVNIVPDFDKSSCRLTEYLTNRGIIAGAGHTNATFDQFARAVEAGLKYCIHFTNGPTGGSYKPFDGGGAIEAVLTLEDVYVELIADGYHINPAYILDIIKRKGIDKIIGMTDSMFVTGSNVKQFEIAGVKAQLSKEGKYIMALDKANILAGSNLTMDRGFENMLNWLSRGGTGIWNAHHEALDFEEALTAAAKMYSTNPCMLTGLNAQGFGSIEDGAKADLCVLDIQGIPGQYQVIVESTIVQGEVVYSRN